MKQYTIEKLEKENLIIFSVITGSYAYGTNIPTSDIDIRGIFIQPLNDILGFGKIDQVSDETNDIIYYEIGRFLDLLKNNNPNILEIINVPVDCIKIMHPIMKQIFDLKNEFITKKCRWSFGGYAIEQIKKARGLNKKMNWEETQMVRKTVLDFCYVLVGGGSMPFKEWINAQIDYRDLNKCLNGNRVLLSQTDIGHAAVDHFHDLYVMYVSPNFEKWGVVSDEDIANDVQLTSIPKDLEVKGSLYFNKDGYSVHCKKYKKFQEWKANRNETRINMVKEHGKKYDGKNLMHTFRLLETALEIAEGKGINVRRNNIEKLLAIRKGEYEYDDLLIEAEELIQKMDVVFKKSNLPENTDIDIVNTLLINMRKEWYKI